MLIQYDACRDRILMGPDQSYKFYLSILGTNHQIYEEAIDTFERENIFISLTHEYFGENRSWDNRLQDFGVAVFAIDDRARAFPGISMSIDFDIGNQPRTLWNNRMEMRAVSIFLVEDIPAVCASLQRRVDYYSNGAGSRDVNLQISLSSHVGAASTLLENGSPTPGSKLSKCLDPLRQIHGVNNVEISGPVSSLYSSDTIAAMCAQPLNATQTMKLVGTQFDRGNKASTNNQLESAISAYKTALQTIRGSCFDRNGDDDVVLIGGRFHGQLASWYVSAFPSPKSPSQNSKMVFSSCSNNHAHRARNIQVMVL